MCKEKKQSGKERIGWQLSFGKTGVLLAGLFGTNETGTSKEGVGSGDCCWALVSQGGTTDGGEHKLTLGGEHNHGHECSKIFC